MRKMSQIPHELIREVQIRTRSAAGLSGYNPSDRTLPALPPLSAAIAATGTDLHRCKNCKGMLLRGSDSIICVYCGIGPHYDVVPDPVCFTSTVGYQWLLRSLRLNGSEMVDTGNKGDQDQGQRSPKSLTRLSDFLNFKVQWPAESEKEEINFSDKHSEETKKPLSLPGLAPDKFFLKSKGNVLSDTPIENSFIHNHFDTAGRKDVDALGDQNLFQNVQSSNPAESSSKHNTTEAFSEWDADFQSADSESQQIVVKSSVHFADTSANSGIKFQDSLSLDPSTGLKVDLTAEIESVFGPGKDLNDGKLRDNPAFDDWDWNNLSSNNSNFSGGIDATISTKDLSTSDDLFQDFQSPTNYSEMAESKTDVEEHNKTINEDLFEEWDDFTGSTSSQVPSQSTWTGGDYQVSTSDQKSSEIDLFSSNNDFEQVDFGGFPQPNLFSTSTSNTNPIMSEIPNWLSESSSPFIESGQAAINVDASEKSTKDDVMMLISQMHDLSFMLETDLSIPSGSDDHISSTKE